ncbi:MAG: hypothetical protein GY757_13515, partial [bacterium]|nr:hypothetical protein [bacterium]
MSVWFVGALSVVILIYSGVLYFSLAHNLRDRLDDTLGGLAKKQYLEIVEGFEETGQKGLDPEDIEDIESLEEEHYFFPVIYAQLLQLKKDRPSGFKLIAKSIQLKDARLPYLAVSKTLAMIPIFTSFSDPRLSSEKMRLVTFPFVLDSRDYIIQFALPQGDVDATLGYLRMIIFITIPLLPL